MIAFLKRYFKSLFSGYGKPRKHEILIILGGLTMIIGSLIAPIFELYTVKTYLWDGHPMTYTYKDMTEYAADLTGQLLWVWALRHYVRFNKLVRCMCQWFIDLIVVDLFYVLFSNPYLIEHSKLIMMAISTVIFLIIYYFDYISLWHFNWMSKRKDTHHGTDKK